MEKNYLGTIYGAELFVKSEDEKTIQNCRKWLEMLDSRYRRDGEEVLRY